MKLFISLLLTIPFSINLLCSQTTLVLQPGPEEGKDAVVRSYSPNTNTGMHKAFRSNSWTVQGVWLIERSFIDFDLSALPESAIVIDAKLSLYSYYDDPYNQTHSTLGGSNESRLQRIITEWDEFEITWNHQPTVTNFNQVFLPESNYATQDYLDIDVTDLILDMINDPENSFGLRIGLKFEHDYRRLAFASSDHHYQNLHPKLVIIYFDQLIADFTFSKVNFTVDFINHSTDATDYLWDFGDGIGSDLENPVHTYNEYGDYVVTLIAFSGDDSDTISKTVHLCELPLSSFEFGIEDYQVIFHNLSLNALSYFWYFDDGNFAYLENPVYTYSEEGEYNVYLVATNDCGPDTSFATVQICIGPTASFDFLQHGFEISFINNSIKSDSCSWDFGDGFGSINTNPVHTYSYEGEYNVILTVYNTCGEDSCNTEISIYLSPVADFDYEINEFEVHFQNLSLNADFFIWDFGDGNTSEENNPVHSYEDIGQYTITLIAFNEYGDDTLVQVLDVTDINNITKDETILIYPNPSEDILYIDFISKFNGKVNYIITDAYGRVVLRDYINTSGTGESCKINTSSLEKGMYILNLTHDGYYQTRKIIVQ